MPLLWALMACRRALALGEAQVAQIPKVHRRVHTGERPYMCARCPKTFKSGANLKRHTLVHTGVRPYPCRVCGARFQQLAAATAHLARIHMKQPAANKRTKHS